MRSSTQMFGDWGEWLALRKLKGYGFAPIPVNLPNCDMKIGKLPVEVKVARPTTRYKRNVGGNKPYRRWQFCIKQSSLNCQGEWLLVLIALDGSTVIDHSQKDIISLEKLAKEKQYFYFLPGSMLQGRLQIQLTSHPEIYKGWLAPFLGKWELIEYLMAEKWRSAPHFFKWLQKRKRAPYTEQSFG